ncbi:nucleoside/nucleotide kinase family protein [Mycoplasmopsis primatum]|uniref:dephospho-CoA kinase n=1 Tax=Mycoplasmopsis primatum TaxID=55604 RepID=UPI000497403A|nr:dephospho-CoA kinase [Mycoplasmopsis primatum]
MIAIIGKIAVGKTFFSNKLIQKGFTVFNCDDFFNHSYLKNNDCYMKINSEIGSFLNDENGISKTKIKSWISQNPNNIDLLEKAIYPILFNKLKIGKFDFVEIPKIIGKNFDFSKLFDNIVCLETPDKIRAKNLEKRNVDNFTKKAISAQNAPFLIKNALFGTIPIVNIYANNFNNDVLFELILKIISPNL